MGKARSDGQAQKQMPQNVTGGGITRPAGEFFKDFSGQSILPTMIP